MIRLICEADILCRRVYELVLGCCSECKKGKIFPSHSLLVFLRIPQVPASPGLPQKYHWHLFSFGVWLRSQAVFLPGRWELFCFCYFVPCLVVLLVYFWICTWNRSWWAQDTILDTRIKPSLSTRNARAYSAVHFLQVL